MKQNTKMICSHHGLGVREFACPITPQKEKGQINMMLNLIDHRINTQCPWPALKVTALTRTWLDSTHMQCSRKRYIWDKAWTPIRAANSERQSYNGPKFPTALPPQIKRCFRYAGAWRTEYSLPHIQIKAQDL